MPIIKKPLKTTKEKSRKKDNKFDKFMDKVFKLNTHEIALIWSVIFILWVLTEYMIISNFVWWFSTPIYLINLQNAVLFFLLLFFIFFAAIIYSYVFVFILVITLVLLCLWFDLKDYYNYIFIIWGIISFLLLFIKQYRNFIKTHKKITIGIFWITFIIWYFLLINVVSNEYKEVKLYMNNEIIDWNLYFSNWDYYFVKIDWEKSLIPCSDVERIDLVE